VSPEASLQKKRAITQPGGWLAQNCWTHQPGLTAGFVREEKRPAYFACPCTSPGPALLLMTARQGGPVAQGWGLAIAGTAPVIAWPKRASLSPVGSGPVDCSQCMTADFQDRPAVIHAF